MYNLLFRHNFLTITCFYRGFMIELNHQVIAVCDLDGLIAWHVLDDIQATTQL